MEKTSDEKGRVNDLKGTGTAKKVKSSSGIDTENCVSKQVANRSQKPESLTTFLSSSE